MEFYQQVLLNKRLPDCPGDSGVSVYQFTRSLDITATNGIYTFSSHIGWSYDYSFGMAAYFSFSSTLNYYIRNSYASGIQYTGG